MVDTAEPRAALDGTEQRSEVGQWSEAPFPSPIPHYAACAGGGWRTPGSPPKGEKVVYAHTITLKQVAARIRCSPSNTDES